MVYVNYCKYNITGSASMPLQCLALMCTETKNCNGMNGNPIQGDNAYLLNVRLHREWSGE